MVVMKRVLVSSDSQRSALAGLVGYIGHIEWGICQLVGGSTGPKFNLFYIDPQGNIFSWMKKPLSRLR